MGFDISKYKAPTDNGRWAINDLMTALKVATILNLTGFKKDVEYSCEITNDNGAIVKLHTNTNKVDNALEFINSGKHNGYIKAVLGIRKHIHPSMFEWELLLLESNGNNTKTYFIDGEIFSVTTPHVPETVPHTPVSREMSKEEMAVYEYYAMKKLGMID